MNVSLLRLTLALVCLLISVDPVQAQVEAEPILEGRVLRGDAPLDSGTVTLHRVAPDTAGEIDSTGLGEGGAFRFRLPTVPDPGGRNELYFASIRHQGVLYFGVPVTTAAQLDSLYRIEVHDTTGVPSGGAELPLTVRYMILEPAGDTESEVGASSGEAGEWRMTDLFQVHNPGARTLVAPEGETVWSHPLPDAALSPRLGAGDMGPDAVTLDGGVLAVRAPIPPGERQLIVRYDLEGPQLDIPLRTSVQTLELLVREPAPPLDVEGLEASEPVQMDAGSTYRRYVGTDLGPGTIRIQRGEEATPLLSGRWIAVMLAFLLAGVGIWVMLREPNREEAPVRGTPDGGGEAPATREPLLLEVARIDEALESGNLERGEAQRLRTRRQELIARLGRRSGGG